ncbi:MAG TPA: hypothetical protein VJN70_11940 [Gemmatimonadaceae bacterium]|nr:hypothetical protein [Gemmatimonadaceae bacterium]
MISVYEFRDRLIVMADRRTDAGYWQDSEPVVRLELSATPEMLGAAVQRVMTEAVGVVAATHWKEYSVVRKRLAAAAGFRALGVFDRLARHCTVRESEDGIFAIMPKRHGGTRGDDKGFHELPNLEFVVDFMEARAIGLAVRRGLDLSTWPPK